MWNAETTPKTSLRSQIFTADGKPGPTAVVSSGWSILDQQPAVADSGEHLSAVFSGMRSGWSGELTSASTLDGRSWTEDGQPLTQTQYPGGSAAVDDAGTVAVATNSSAGMIVNKGAPAGSDVKLAAPSGTTAYFPALARDARTGTVWAAWYWIGNTPATTGVFVQPAFPTVGKVAKAAGSTDAKGFGAVLGKRVALASGGGGVWLAYVLSDRKTIRLWKLGTAVHRDLRPGPDVTNVSLSSGPLGTLWVSWANSVYDHNTVGATRSNPAVTAFEPMSTTALPKGNGSIYGIASEGSVGPLDVVVNTGSTLIHTQIQPRLTVGVSPASVKGRTGGTITISVRDAGIPVPDATVTVAGVKRTTGERGTVTVTVARGSKAAVVKVAATKRGYVAAVSAYRILGAN